MRVAVYGSGGHGKVVADILQAAGKHKVVGFLDDDPSAETRRVIGLPVHVVSSEPGEAARSLHIEGIVLGIGDNRARHRIAERCRRDRVPIVSAVHPRATVAASAEVEEGVVIMAGAVVNPNARLEEGVVVNTSASIDHDCLLHRYSHVWPGAHLAGSVEVGEFSYIGMGASVIQNLRIGKNVTIGAGAVVIRNIEDGVTAVGIPARRIKPKSASRGSRR